MLNDHSPIGPCQMGFVRLHQDTPSSTNTVEAPSILRSRPTNRPRHRLRIKKSHSFVLSSYTTITALEPIVVSNSASISLISSLGTAMRRILIKLVDRLLLTSPDQSSCFDGFVLLDLRGQAVQTSGYGKEREEAGIRYDVSSVSRQVVERRDRVGRGAVLRLTFGSCSFRRTIDRAVGQAGNACSMGHFPS